MTFEWNMPLTIAVVVVSILAIAALTGLLALNEHVWRIDRLLGRFIAWLARLGERLRTFKNERLEPLTDIIPMSADTQTTARFFCFVICVHLITEGRWVGASWAFWIGWFFDLTDGLTARRRGSSQFGKYIDPFVDVPFLIIFCFILAPSYRWPWLAQTIGWVFISRVGLYLLFLGRAWLRTKQFRLDILPVTLEGQYKTVFVVISFGLIMLDPTRQWSWVAEIVLGWSLILEVVSLLVHGRRALRIIRQPTEPLEASDRSVAP